MKRTMQERFYQRSRRPSICSSWLTCSCSTPIFSFSSLMIANLSHQTTNCAWKNFSSKGCLRTKRSTYLPISVSRSSSSTWCTKSRYCFCSAGASTNGYSHWFKSSMRRGRLKFRNYKKNVKVQQPNQGRQNRGQRSKSRLLMTRWKEWTTCRSFGLIIFKSTPKRSIQIIREVSKPQKTL